MHLLTDGDITKTESAESESFRRSAETLALRAESHVFQREYTKNRAKKK